jgi:hypothetical protein
VWHLAHVLASLQEQQYKMTPAILEVAVTTMQVNLSKEKKLMDRKLEERVQHLFA